MNLRSGGHLDLILVVVLEVNMLTDINNGSRQSPAHYMRGKEETWSSN